MDGSYLLPGSSHPCEGGSRCPSCEALACKKVCVRLLFLLFSPLTDLNETDPACLGFVTAVRSKPLQPILSLHCAY
jgi:hypothetical protein